MLKASLIAHTHGLLRALRACAPRSVDLHELGDPGPQAAQALLQAALGEEAHDVLHHLVLPQQPQVRGAWEGLHLHLLPQPAPHKLFQ